jgi:signal transduction histidine kinase/HAMP domain-containing protein
MWLIGQLRSRIRYKIIWPFLLLAVCIAIFGSAIAFSLIAGSWQERFVNQLAASTRIANDTLLAQERSNLVFLRQIALSGANTQTGAPAVSTALANNDLDDLLLALDPFVRVGIADSNVQLDRLIIFDTAGRSRVDLERSVLSDIGYRRNDSGQDLASFWFVPQVLAESAAGTDDKYASLVEMQDGDGNRRIYLATVVPIREGENTPIIGGALMAVSLDSVLSSLLQRSHAAIVTIYSTDGAALASTAFPAAANLVLPEPAEEERSPEGIAQLRIADTDLHLLQTNARPENLDDKPVVTTITAAGRDYQVFYTYLVINSRQVGILSTGMPADYVSQWSNSTRPLILGLTMLVMLAVIGIGMLITRQITAPLEQLVATAGNFVSGGSHQDSAATMLPLAGSAEQDEVSKLSSSFQRLTDQQRRLIRDVLRESGLRAAILESIPDGLVVCDSLGHIQHMNPMMYRFLDLNEGDPLPASVSDLPLEPVNEPIFGMRMNDLYLLNNRYLRLSKKPIFINHEAYAGDVYFLQDMTAEAKVDQAKTTFTATISHEMRTPLTVINGNAQFLQRGLLGELNPDQKMMVDSINKHSSNMSRALVNIIQVAELDSGAVTLSIEPLDSAEVVQEVVNSFKRQIADKQLDLHIDIPPDLPAIAADRVMVTRALEQLLHNALTYTTEGSINVVLRHTEDRLQVDVRDSGSGIAPELQPHIFDRFVRGSGDEANSRTERGIGLGLTIAQQMITLQQGEIRIADTSNHGTTVRFTLPLATVPAAQPVDDPLPAVPAPQTDPPAEVGANLPEPVGTYPASAPALALPGIATCLVSTILPDLEALPAAQQSLHQAGFQTTPLPSEPATEAPSTRPDLGLLQPQVFQELLLETLPLLHERWLKRRRPLSPLTEWARQHFFAVLSLDETSPSATGILAAHSKHLRPLFNEARISGLFDLNNHLPHALWFDEARGTHWNRYFWERTYTMLQPGTLLITAPSSYAYAAMADVSDMGVGMIITSPPAHGWRVLQTLAQNGKHCDRLVQFQSRHRTQKRTWRLVEQQEFGKIHRYLTNSLDPAVLPAAQMHALCRQQQSIRSRFVHLSRILAREHGPLDTHIWSSSRNAAQIQVWSAWLLYIALIDCTDQLAERLQRPAAGLALDGVYHQIRQHWQHRRPGNGDPFDPLFEHFEHLHERFPGQTLMPTISHLADIQA